MRVFGKPYSGLLCVALLCTAALSLVAAREVDAQPPAPARADLPKVGKVPVADVLRRLGAKLEGGSEAKDLDAYSRHFDRTDPNRDGKHTRAEYVEKGVYMTPQARAGIFRAADGNADGVVTKAEYVLNRIITDEAKTIVGGMDDDRDGLVERAEFVKHAAKLLSGPELAAQVFAALDANADGGITTAEYLRIWGQWARAGRKPAEERIATRRAELADPANTPDPKPVESHPGGGPPPGRPGAGTGPPSVDEVFKRFDRNEDGKLQKNEIPEFARQFILPADANGDDMVTKEELQASRRRQRPSGRPAAGAPR
ncbi:MAG: EF-hand domain-containing protein [Planctomycetes bacterium]|nr:EF-hand domain-containing protein [Planctomycetota bacterium]